MTYDNDSGPDLVVYCTGSSIEWRRLDTTSQCELYSLGAA